jgi:hypothetical protein
MSNDENTLFAGSSPAMRTSFHSPLRGDPERRENEGCCDVARWAQAGENRRSVLSLVRRICFVLTTKLAPYDSPRLL